MTWPRGAVCTGRRLHLSSLGRQNPLGRCRGVSAEGLQGLVLTAAASALLAQPLGQSAAASALLAEHSRHPIAAAALESLVDDAAADEASEGSADRPDPSEAFRLGSVRPA